MIPPSGTPVAGPFRPGERVIETDLGDESILLDPETQEMYSLRGTGRAVWRALPAPDLSALVDALCAEYDVARERASADVLSLLTDLLEAGLIEAGAATGGDA